MVIDHARRLALPLIAIAGIALAALALLPVPQDRQALVLRMGRPLRVINGWNGGGWNGGAGAGLALRVPLIDSVVWLDRRTMSASDPDEEVTLADGQKLTVTARAFYRVVDPVRFVATFGADGGNDPLRPLLAARLHTAFARADLPGALALARGAGEADLRAALATEARDYGVAVDQVEIAAVTLPDGAPVEAALARMGAGQAAQATLIAAQAHKDAALIRADAQAQASAIYAASFAKDPDFYDFYRAMQSYAATLGQKGSKTALVLSPDAHYLQQFRGK